MVLGVVHPTCICSDLQDEAPHSSRPPAPAWLAAPFREPELFRSSGKSPSLAHQVVSVRFCPVEQSAAKNSAVLS